MSDDDVEPEVDENEDGRELNEKIDDWLSEERPERYDRDDKEWMDLVVKRTKRALEEQPPDEVVEDAARRRVYSREGVAIRRADRLLREIQETDQLPIGWGPLFTQLKLPLKIDRARIRFGALTTEDLEEWAQENERRQRDHDDEQEVLREGARKLAAWMTAAGVRRAQDLHARPGVE